jgi:hypothetical protein
MKKNIDDSPLTINDSTVQECDATGDAMKSKSLHHKKMIP